MQEMKIITADRRTNNFDFIRFAAAFFVIYGHSNFLFGSVPPSVLGMPISSIGVAVFFQSERLSRNG